MIDLRNYPSSFMVFALGSHLVDTPTSFARFTAGDLTNPGHSTGASRFCCSRQSLTTGARS